MRDIEGLLEQKLLVEHYLAESRQCLSAFSFVNIFAWQDFFNFEFKVFDDYLYILASDELGKFLYLPPLGKNITQEIIDQCFDLMGESKVARIENVDSKMISLFSKEEYKIYKKADEYGYLKKDIIDFKGNAYKSKRSSYNQFVKNNSYRYVPFEKGMLDECSALYDVWAKGRYQEGNDIFNHMLKENAQVHRLVTEHYKELNLVGRVVEVDGEIKAYTFGYALNEFHFCVLFEITDLSIKGLATYIFREFCQDKIWKPYEVVNVMDDFEMDNIKKTKMSFRPEFLWTSYSVTKKLI